MLKIRAALQQNLGVIENRGGRYGGPGTRERRGKGPERRRDMKEITLVGKQEMLGGSREVR